MLRRAIKARPDKCVIFFNNLFLNKVNNGQFRQDFSWFRKRLQRLDNICHEMRSPDKTRCNERRLHWNRRMLFCSATKNLSKEVWRLPCWLWKGETLRLCPYREQMVWDGKLPESKIVSFSYGCLWWQTLCHWGNF